MSVSKGYAQIYDPEAPVQEWDTVSCCHCSAIIFIKPGTNATVYLINQIDGTWKEESGAGCYKCGYKPVCIPCFERGVCTPLERMLEEAEGRLKKGRLIF